MSTRSRNQSNPEAARPPLVGRLHELATTRPVTTRADPEGWWQQPRLAGEALIRNPQVAVFGSLGSGKCAVRAPSSWLLQGGGKTALMRWLYLDALRFTERPVGVFDEAADVAALYGLEGHALHRTVKQTHHPADMDPRYRGRQGR